MKKNLFKKGVGVLGAILLLANTILPGMVAYADPIPGEQGGEQGSQGEQGGEQGSQGEQGGEQGSQGEQGGNDQQDETQGCNSSEHVACIGNTGYSDFIDARNEVNNGETIKIMKNFDGSYYGNQSKSFDIDLNGHTIDISLQINGGSIGVKGQGTINAKSAAAFWIIAPDSSLTIDGATINGQLGIGVEGNGNQNISIENSTIHGTTYSSIQIAGKSEGKLDVKIDNSNVISEKMGINNYSYNAGGELNITIKNNSLISGDLQGMELRGNNGGKSTISLDNTSKIYGDCGVAIREYASGKTIGKDITLNINGEVQGINSFGITVLGNIRDDNNNSPIINVGNAAKITSKEAAGIYQAGYSVISVADGAEIIGGDTAIETRAGELTINGGNFSVTTNQCPPTVNPNGNGSTTVGAALAVAQHTTNNSIDITIKGGEFIGCAAVYVTDPQYNDYEVNGQKKNGNVNVYGRENLKNVTTTINGGMFKGFVKKFNADGDDSATHLVLNINGGTFKEDPTEYVAKGQMVGQSETEYIVGTPAELKDVESDANYIASPTTKVAFGASGFDDTTLSSRSVEIKVVEKTGSAIKIEDKPADGDMKVNAGNTATVEGQVDIVFSGHSNAKFNTAMLIRIPITPGKTKARFMVRHKGDKFNYKGLTTNPDALCDLSGDVKNEADKYNGKEVTVTGNYAVIGACSASTFIAYTETAKVTSPGNSGRPASSSSTTKKDDKKDDTQVIELKGEVTEESTTTGEVKEENTKSDVIISDAAKAAYNDEQLAAYQWAYDNGITTINDADKARLSDPLTRAELAKMMSQYISSVLKKSPIKTDLPRYKDVDESLGDLADYIVKAYQYQIMGINADGSALENFNPNGLVTRADFATVFSRVLYGDKYNQAGDDYYSKHIAALKEAGILSNDDPTIQEVRGWVMLMMYRSANEKASTQEESKTEEGTGNNVGIANPASTYCVEQEGKIEIREDAEGAQYGVCKFKDGTEVEEWEYFRANHKDETTTGAVAESSAGAVAEATTGATAETSTGSTTKSN